MQNVWLIEDPFPGFRGWRARIRSIRRGAAPPQARWTTLFRLILAIPAYVLMVVFGIVLQVIALIAWFACLGLGRCPRGMRDLMAYCLRYQAQTYAYLFLLTGRYPSLAGGSGYRDEEV